MRFARAFTGLGLVLSMIACSSADSGEEKVAPAPQEICNFVDDDGDGLVDEGFAWSAGPTHTVHRTTRFSNLSTAEYLPDGNVVIAGLDNYGEKEDEAFVLVLSPAGEVVRGPAKIPIGGPTNGAGIARLPSGDLVLILGATDWEKCKKAGCPTHVVTLDPSDLHVKKNVLLTSDEGLQAPRQLACNAATCVTSLSWPDGRSYGLAWFDPTTGDVVRTIEWPESGSGMFAAGDVIFWVSTSTYGEPPQNRLHVGVSSLDGLQQLVPAKVIADGGVMTLPNYAGIALLKDSALFSYAATNDGGTEAVSYIVGLDGVVRSGPKTPAQYAGSYMSATAGGGPIVAAGLNRVASMLWRLGPDQSLLNVPNNPMSFDYALGPINVAVDGGMLLVSSTYDGHTVDVARVQCIGAEQ